jgi:hypothetical protein
MGVPGGPFPDAVDDVRERTVIGDGELSCVWRNGERSNGLAEAREVGQEGCEIWRQGDGCELEL